LDCLQKYCAVVIREELENNGDIKACIAFAGFTLFEIKTFADKYDFCVLDGTKDLQDRSFFLSDLEQTKGYEFDIVFILNCKSAVLPASDMPVEEQFRDACRFYVAMTRAKKSLFLTHSKDLSDWISNDKCRPFFDFDSIESFCNITNIPKFSIPEKMSQSVCDPSVRPLDLAGRAFIYTSHAIGMTIELQEKIDDLIDGIGLDRDGRRIRWVNVRAALTDVQIHPHVKQLFGAQKTWKDFVDSVDGLP
jgi:hypothetical protein